MSQPAPDWFPYAFPFFFLGMWLTITTVLGYVSGWPSLEQRFPDREEQSIDRMHMQSGSIGNGSLYNPWGNVNYNGCLTLDVCPSGLRVSVWRIFGPFSRPFFVPWQKISVEPVKFLFFQYYRLTFGNYDLPALTIKRSACERITASGQLSMP